MINHIGIAILGIIGFILALITNWLISKKIEKDNTKSE